MRQIGCAQRSRRRSSDWRRSSAKADDDSVRIRRLAPRVSFEYQDGNSNSRCNAMGWGSGIVERIKYGAQENTASVDSANAYPKTQICTNNLLPVCVLDEATSSPWPVRASAASRPVKMSKWPWVMSTSGSFAVDRACCKPSPPLDTRGRAGRLWVSSSRISALSLGGCAEKRGAGGNLMVAFCVSQEWSSLEMFAISENFLSTPLTQAELLR